jgi:hypothetical protein
MEKSRIYISKVSPSLDWSSAVAKNCEKKFIQKEMKKAVTLAIDEHDKERNVIMFNVHGREIND